MKKDTNLEKIYKKAKSNKERNYLIVQAMRKGYKKNIIQSMINDFVKRVKK